MGLMEKGRTEGSLVVVRESERKRRCTGRTMQTVGCKTFSEDTTGDSLIIKPQLRNKPMLKFTKISLIVRHKQKQRCSEHIGPNVTVQILDPTC